MRAQVDKLQISQAYKLHLTAKKRMRNEEILVISKVDKLQIRSQKNLLIANQE